MSPQLFHLASVIYRVIGLFILMMGLRLGVALLIAKLFGTSVEEDIYHLIAQNLLRGKGFMAEPGGAIIIHRAPLYPFFLAGVYSMFGETSLRALVFVQAALDAGTALLTWSIGKRMFGEGIGLTAALLFALYPLSAYYTLRPMSEPLYTFALMAMLAWLQRATNSSQPRHFLLAGILAGAAALVKPIVAGFVPVLGILLLARTRKQVLAIAPQVACLLVAFALFITPWTLRNYRLTGHVIPIATGGGYSFWIGNNVLSDGREDDELEGVTKAAYHRRRQAILAKLDGQGPWESRYSYISYEVDQAFARAALQEMQAHPLAVLTLLAKKFFRLWFGVYQPHNRWANPVVYLLQGSLLLFAAYGIMLLKQSLRASLPLLAIVVYTALVHTLTLATLRYSIPLVPVLMLFATIGARDVGSRFAQRIRGSLTPMGARTP